MSTDSYRERYYYSRDKLRLYFRDYGDPQSTTPPVLCLPGLTRNSKDFEYIATQLSENHRVICPDYRGRGRSEYDPRWKNYNAFTYAKDILRLIKLENLSNVVILGTSLGGLLGIGMGFFKPSRIAGIVLNDIGPEVHHEGLRRIVDYIQFDRPQPNWEQAVVDLKRTFPNMTLKSDSDWMKFAYNTYKLGPDGKLHFDWDMNILHAIGHESNSIPNLWPMFKACRRIPILVLRGSESDILTEHTVERMAMEHPKLFKATVPGAGHTPTLYEPESQSAMGHFFAAVKAGFA